MSTTSKSKNKADEVKGKIKEKAGEATGNRDLEAHGKADQAKSNLRQAGDKVKGGLRH